MLSNILATINANANSVIETDPGKIDVMCSFNGYIDGNKKPSINKTIQNQELYNENKAIARQDEDDFEDYLLSLVQ